MSGHSKWHSIKHKKAATDAKRGKMFSKVAKEITVAAKIGGGDPDANPRLRTAIGGAKALNMPNDRIDRAIMRGTGELPGVSYEEARYEGYGPAGVALLVEVLTDKKNRTASEVRTMMAKKGGNMAGIGSVAWIFEKKGLFSISREKIDEEKLFDLAIEAGAEDIKTEEQDVYEIITNPSDFDAVRKALEDKGIAPEIGSITSIPKNTVKLDEKHAAAVLSLVNALEELDDVQNVYANFDIPDEILERLSQEQ
jgi:YebC/PmpR family DNA-binding regulatory protein